MSRTPWQSRTLAVRPQLLAAAKEARREGWAIDEYDVLHSVARTLGVRLWPNLCRELMEEAWRTSAVQN